MVKWSPGGTGGFLSLYFPATLRPHGREHFAARMTLYCV